MIFGNFTLENVKKFPKIQNYELVKWQILGFKQPKLISHKNLSVRKVKMSVFGGNLILGLFTFSSLYYLQCMTMESLKKVLNTVPVGLFLGIFYSAFHFQINEKKNHSSSLEF